jgi:hypothetical protein
MEFSTLALIIFGILAVVNIVCTIILYPGLKEIAKELKEDS